MKIIKIKNQYLEIADTLLSGFTLDEKKSSARRRFLRAIKPFTADLNSAREELRNRYVKKDEKDQPLIKDNQYQFSVENKKKVDKEWIELNEETISIDVTPANEQDIATVISFIKDATAKFITEKKNEFNASDYDYVATLEELLEMFTPVEVKTKTK